MNKDLKLIQAMCLLCQDLRTIGPRAVEEAFANPSSSWILKDFDKLVLDEMEALFSIVCSSEFTHETFKDFLVTADLKSGSSVEEIVIEHFIWANHSALPIRACAEIARRGIPKDRRPNFKDLDAMMSELDSYRASHDAAA